MIEQFNKLLEPLKRSIRTLIGRAVVDTLKRDGNAQLAQVITEGGGAIDEVEYIEPFGFTGSPPDGQHPGIYHRLNADGSQTILVCIDGRKYRIKVSADEAAMYNSQGDRVHIRNNGEVYVKASNKVYAETPLFECSNDCIVGGNMQVKGTTQLMNTTTIEAGSFVCAAQAVFSSSAGFLAAITNMGKSIGGDHEHTGGTENDGTTGAVK